MHSPLLVYQPFILKRFPYLFLADLLLSYRVFADTRLLLIYTTSALGISELKSTCKEGTAFILYVGLLIVWEPDFHVDSVISSFTLNKKK